MRTGKKTNAAVSAVESARIAEIKTAKGVRPVRLRRVTRRFNCAIICLHSILSKTGRVLHFQKARKTRAPLHTYNMGTDSSIYYNSVRTMCTFLLKARLFPRRGGAGRAEICSQTFVYYNTSYKSSCYKFITKKRLTCDFIVPTPCRNGRNGLKSGRPSPPLPALNTGA